MADQNKYTNKLKGTKVLIIGGSSGIGFGVAEALIEHGAASVIISSSNPDRVEKSIERLQKSYPSAASKLLGYACNLGDEANLESNIVHLFEKIGKVDHVVHSAGDRLGMMSLGDATLDRVKQVGMVRFFSALMVGKVAPKYLTGGPRSSITLTTGAVSERPHEGWTVVNMYATGLQGMCRALALDLKPIRVNLVSPGAVDTELWDAVWSGDEKQKRLNMLAEKLPTGRAGRVEDVAESYIYLMKDENITGSMISTNGGSLLS